MEPGLYVTFFAEGELPADALPPVGPFDYLVAQPGILVADRRSVAQTGNVGGFRWVEAELELQRALGYERGGVRRPDLRITAPDGVYMRFASLESSAGEEQVPELGPYAVIVVTRHGVAADGDAIAVRPAISDRAWVIRGGGPALAGIIRPDIAFRTRTTNYHPQIHQAGPTIAAPAPKPEPVRPPERVVAPGAPTVPPLVVRPAAPVITPASAPVIRPAPAPVITPAPAPLIRPAPAPVIRPAAAPVIRPAAAPVVTPPPPPPAPTPKTAPAPSPQRTALDDRASTDDAAALRARLGGALRTDLGTTEAEPSPEELSRRNARFWAGVALIGALVLVLGAFGVFALRGALTSGPAGVSVVGIGKVVKGAQFDYTVATSSRAPSVGAARAQGTYLIVFVTITYRGADRATLSPTAFRLVDGGGAQYSALSESDPVYQSGSNPGSPLVWKSLYQAGQAASTPVIFDVDATLSGVQLMILEVPTVRVRLD